MSHLNTVVCRLRVQHIAVPVHIAVLYRLFGSGHGVLFVHRGNQLKVIVQRLPQPGETAKGKHGGGKPGFHITGPPAV